MKNRVIFYMVCTCISLSSCLDKNNLNLSDRDKEEELDLSFDFGMISEKKLEITTRSNSGSAIPDVPFYVYLENPYTEEGDRRTDIFPLYSGKTAESGTIKATLAVPNTATTLYVYTPVSSFEMIQTCEIQNNMNITFTTTGVNAKSAKARAGEEGVFTGRRNAKVIEASTNLYSFYNFQLTDGASGGIINDGKSNDKEVIEAGNTLTSKEITLASNYFPERVTVEDEKYFGENYCTDLEITPPANTEGTFQGAHVWVTLIGDGGFSINNNNVANALCYYTYTGNLTADDAQTIHKTIIYPNTNTKRLTNSASATIGSKIQLLYWDEKSNQYVDTFPEGVKIGWVMISNGIIGNYSNYKMIGNYRFSTSILNSKIGNFPGNYTNGITRWCEEAQMNIVGMENRQHNDENENNDKDYNDILFKVTSDPIMKPKDEIPVAPEEYVSSISGTLAFEDNWPQKGDYDFNDFVTGYSYSLIKGNNNKDVKAIRLTFIPRALGASYNSGFGIQLPIETNNIENVTGGNIEKDETKATIIIYEDTRKDAFGGHGGFINTQKGNAEIAGTKQNVYITLKSNIGLNSFKDFNPFIYVVNRNHEIHLTDKAPTSKMDISLFGREEDDDCSMPEKGYYYRMDNDYPWALDIPSSNNSLNNLWRYPIEGKGVSEAYPDYLNWTSASGHHINWLDKQNSAYIY